MRRLLIFLLTALLVSGCANGVKQSNTSANNSPIELAESKKDQSITKEIDPKQITKDVIDLLKNKDLPRLAAYVHPVAGVRFTPYGYIDVQRDVTMSAIQLQDAFEDDTIMKWGYYDGTGDPIHLSFADYFEKFVYSKDYANADQISFNETIGLGNSLHNINEVYPDAFVAEYHFNGTAQFNEMDWSSLRIVLIRYQSDWVVSGIIHDQWTT